jgi:hypothetical protein
MFYLNPKIQARTFVSTCTEFLNKHQNSGFDFLILVKNVYSSTRTALLDKIFTEIQKAVSTF